MEAVHPQSNRVLAAVAVLVVTGWAWSLSNVSIPDVLWLVNAGLTVLLVVLLVVAGLRRVRRR